MSAPTGTRKPNRLAMSASPYLLQHAHNPVDWFPWGAEALEKARREDKPIFLSIGYSSCHWCHVMERESFEDEGIAALLNERFVPVKVDREERPDLDEVYMTSVQMMTGQGGWPLTVFLTPDLKPFYGGTYFPPVDRWGRPGLRTLLERLDSLYRERRVEMEVAGARIAAELARAERPEGGDAPAREWIARAVDAMRARFDEAHGGFGSAPKFPPAMGLLLLLREHGRTGDRSLLHMVERTLDAMAAGGIYDHLGGGFARYSTDREWLVPHFEKMLYDNALLAAAYTEAWQATGRPLYRRVAEETCDFVLREMRGADGGFLSALDADSEGVEGKYYVWTRAEVEAALGAEDARRFCALYDVSEGGNWEGGRNVLRLDPHDAHALADPAQDGRRALVDGWRARLLEARSRRVRPGEDGKAIAAWNGLAIWALAQAGAAFEAPRFLEAAAAAADFTWTRLRPDGTLLRAHHRGRAEVPGFLEDCALLGLGMEALFESTGEPGRLEAALALAEEMERRFWDEREGIFYFAEPAHATPLARTVGGEDGAMPGANSAAAFVLIRLARLTGRSALEERARRVLAARSVLVARAPGAFHFLLCAVHDLLAPSREVVVVGDARDARTTELWRAATRRYQPHAVLIRHDPTETEAERRRALVPGLAGREGADPMAYLCEGFACRQPCTDPDEFARQLAG